MSSTTLTVTPAPAGADVELPSQVFSDFEGESSFWSSQHKGSVGIDALFRGPHADTTLATHAFSRRTLLFHDRETELAFRRERHAVIQPRWRALMVMILLFNLGIFAVTVADEFGATQTWTLANVALSGFGYVAICRKGEPFLSAFFVAFCAIGSLGVSLVRALNGDESPGWSLGIFLPVLGTLLRTNYYYARNLIVYAICCSLGCSLLYQDASGVFVSVLPTFYIGFATAHSAYLSEKDERHLFVIAGQLQRQQTSLKDERDQIDRLLYNVFPRDIARVVALSPDGESATLADTFPSGSVLLLDIVGFTKLSASLSAAELVHILNTLFAEFDRLAESYSVLKIKTIGDAYLAVAGCPIPRDGSAVHLTHFALDLLEATLRVSSKLGHNFSVRIGLATGEFGGAIVGSSKRLYDVFGPAVDSAFALEASSEPMQVLCDAAHRDAIGDVFRLSPKAPADESSAEAGQCFFVTGRTGQRPSARELRVRDAAILASYENGKVEASATARRILQTRIDARRRRTEAAGGSAFAVPNEDEDEDEEGEGGDLGAPELHLARWTLRFPDPEIEDEFQASRLQRYSLHTVAWIASLAVFEALWVIADTELEVDEEVPYAVPVRVGVAVPLLMLAAGLSLPWTRARIGVALSARLTNIVVFVAATASMTKMLAILAFEGLEQVPRDTIATDMLVYGAFLVMLPRSPLIPTIVFVVASALLSLVAYPVGGLTFGTLILFSFFYFVFIGVFVFTRYEADKLERMSFFQHRLLTRNNQLLADRIAHAQALILTVLPPSVYNRLLETTSAYAETFSDATVLFVSIARFSSLARKLTVDQLVAALSELFEHFEGMCEAYQVEKIKAFDGTFMCVAGILGAGDNEADHVRRSVELSLAMLHHVETTKVRALDGIPGVKPKVQLRIGLQSGPVAAGVIGTTRFSFDCWSDTVNTASRMQSKGAAGAVQMPIKTFERVEDLYDCETATVKVKGKGEVPVARVRERRQVFGPGKLAPL